MRWVFGGMLVIAPSPPSWIDGCAWAPDSFGRNWRGSDQPVLMPGLSTTPPESLARSRT